MLDQLLGFHAAALVQMSLVRLFAHLVSRFMFYVYYIMIAGPHYPITPLYPLLFSLAKYSDRRVRYINDWVEPQQAQIVRNQIVDVVFELTGVKCEECVPSDVILVQNDPILHSWSEHFYL